MFTNRNFLFLQGPHGPFYRQLGKLLAASGADIWRVGFNAGDQAFWPDRKTYLPYRGAQPGWPAFFRQTLDEKSITDIVVYGDTRPIHAEAIRIARDRGLRVHVFEEGYLRPYWITYERHGSNGNSPLMDMPLEHIRHRMHGLDSPPAPPPAKWGDMRQHIFYGALYHWFVLFLNARYPNYKPHRALSLLREFRLHLRRLLLIPALAIQRSVNSGRVARGGYPYHVVLMQLEHDSAFQDHSPYATSVDFLTEVLSSFAAAAPAHHHLIIKAHPLDDGRAPIRPTLRRLMRQLNIRGRVHYIPGGKLAPLLNESRSAITVNSTAGQQALWRGLPLKALGRTIYDKPGLVSDQSLTDFFSDPQPPDQSAYHDFRRFLLATSQVQGGFYSYGGRKQALRRLADLMLSQDNPYARMARPKATRPQQLRSVS